MHRISLLSYKVHEERQTSDAGKGETEFAGSSRAIQGTLTAGTSCMHAWRRYGSGTLGRER